MTLNKYRLGDLISQRTERYDGMSSLPVTGLSSDGLFAVKQICSDTRLYHVFYNRDFVLNPARMELNSIALNKTWDKAICSSLYEIFFVNKKNVLLPEYLNLFIKRDEFARHCKFLSQGSAFNYCRCKDIAEIEIQLPPLSVQKKYAVLYDKMFQQQQILEKSLSDLKLASERCIADLIQKLPEEKLGPYIIKKNLRNRNHTATNIKSISVTKEFRDPIKMPDPELTESYKIVKPHWFAFVPTTHNEKVFACALNGTDEDIAVFYLNEVFSVDRSKLLPEYLAMFLRRTEFDRYVRFHSWGTSKEFFTWEDLKEVKIPIADMDQQKAAAAIYTAYQKRKLINQKMKAQLKTLCPLLIKASLDEGRSL